MALLLTSHPPVLFNRVALILWVLVPDQDEESFVFCDGEIARPSLFNGKDKLTDSSGEEWTVLHWHVRDDLLKEETDFFDTFFEALEDRKPVSMATTTSLTPGMQSIEIPHPAILDRIHKGVEILVEDKDRKAARYSEGNEKNGGKGGGRKTGDNANGYDPKALYKEIALLIDQGKTQRFACATVVKKFRLKEKIASVARQYRRYAKKL
jgi:hypothetical protein